MANKFDHADASLNRRIGEFITKQSTENLVSSNYIIGLAIEHVSPKPFNFEFLVNFKENDYIFHLFEG